MYAIADHAKYKKSDVRGIQFHNQRESKRKTLSNINPEKTFLNYDLVNDGPINYLEKIGNIINEYRTPTTKAIRHDAVVMTSWVISATPIFFKDLPAREQRKFFEDALEFFKNRYGAHLIVAANVHMDETTPHMHITMVPLMYDNKNSTDETDVVKLCSRDLFNKSEFRYVNEHFFRHLNTSGGGKREFQKPLEDGKKRHITKGEWIANQDKDAEIESLKSEIEEIENGYKTEREEIIKELNATKTELEETKKELHAAHETIDQWEKYHSENEGRSASDGPEVE